MPPAYGSAYRAFSNPGICRKVSRSKNGVMILAYPVSSKTIFSANSCKAYCLQTFMSSFSFFTAACGSGITATPSSFSFFWISAERDPFSSFPLPLNAPKDPSRRRPMISLPPALALILTRGPNAGHLRTHMQHPLPYVRQFPIGPVEPVVSTNTSPSMVCSVSPPIPAGFPARISFSMTASCISPLSKGSVLLRRVSPECPMPPLRRSRSPPPPASHPDFCSTTSTARAISRTSTPFSRRSLRTFGSTFITS